MEPALRMGFYFEGSREMQAEIEFNLALTSPDDGVNCPGLPYEK